MPCVCCGVTQAKVTKISENQNKVTQIYSPAKLPAPKSLPDFRRVCSADQAFVNVMSVSRCRSVMSKKSMRFAIHAAPLICSQLNNEYDTSPFPCHVCTHPYPVACFCRKRSLRRLTRLNCSLRSAKHALHDRMLTEEEKLKQRRSPFLYAASCIVALSLKRV